MVVNAVSVGDRIWFDEEKQGYTVRAVSPNGRYAICTKPFNPQRTVIYCIVDFLQQKRAPDDYVFGRGYETDEHVRERMDELVAGDLCLSRRYEKRLNVARLRFAAHVKSRLAEPGAEGDRTSSPSNITKGSTP
jgi:hypothetical protein